MSLSKRGLVSFPTACFLFVLYVASVLPVWTIVRVGRRGVVYAENGRSLWELFLSLPAMIEPIRVATGHGRGSTLLWYGDDVVRAGLALAVAVATALVFWLIDRHGGLAGLREWLVSLPQSVPVLRFGLSCLSLQRSSGHSHAAGMKRFDWLLTLCVVSGLATLYIHSEKSPRTGGFGDDGNVIYAPLAKDFPHKAGELIDRYYVQRCVPSAVVYYGLAAASLPHDERHLLAAFTAWNLLMLGACLALGLATANELGLSDEAKVLSLLLTAGSFAVLKWYAWDPLLTDLTAYCSGAVIVWAFVARRPLVLAVAILAGCFVWPTTLYLGLPLLLWPLGTRGRNVSRWLAVSGAVFASALVAGAAWYLWATHYQMPFEQQQPLHHWFGVSVGLAAAFTFFAVRPLLTKLQIALPQNLALALIITGVALAARLAFPVGPEDHAEYGWRLRYTVMSAVAKPGVFIVAHVLWFGPLAALAVVLWPALCAEAERLGPGYLLTLALVAGQSLCSESRGMANCLPLVVTALCLTLSRRRLAWPTIVVLAVAALSIADCWSRFNVHLESDRPSLIVPLVDAPKSYLLNGGISIGSAAAYQCQVPRPTGAIGHTVFPRQWIAMYNAPWMASAVYPMRLARAALVVIIAWAACWTPQPKTKRSYPLTINRRVLDSQDRRSRTTAQLST